MGGLRAELSQMLVERKGLWVMPLGLRRRWDGGLNSWVLREGGPSWAPHLSENLRVLGPKRASGDGYLNS